MISRSGNHLVDLMDDADETMRCECCNKPLDEDGPEDMVICEDCVKKEDW